MQGKERVASLAIAATLLLGGCAATPLALGPDGNVSTASIGTTGGQQSAKAGEEQKQVGSKDAAARGAGRLAAARALRKKGDRAKALAELDRARTEAPENREIAREAGLIALELGQLDKSRKALEASLDPAKPDLQTLSALGTALAAAGKQREAQGYFKKALALKPDHRPTLNNLALSYALDGKLADAEKTLRKAGVGDADSPKQMKENLALVMALAGKFDDAERVATKVLPKQQAQANIAYVRSLTKQGS
ncbi:MAG: tetratricopeptide repeat protein [Hyphomicrobiaceae bacterium]